MEKIIHIDNRSGLILEGGGMRGVFTCGVLDNFHGPGHPLSLYDWCQRGCMQRIVVHVGAAGTCQVQQYRPAGEV